MVVLSKTATEHCSSTSSRKQSTYFSGVPIIDLSKSDSKNHIVNACEEYGFFKVINHGIPMQFISCLESAAIQFFSLPLSEKERAGPANPFGYGNKIIGPNGDDGWVEYLLTASPENISTRLACVFGKPPQEFRTVLNDYMSGVRRMACEILEFMADGLKIQPRNAFSKLLLDEQSDSVFRLNHYPPCPDTKALDGHDRVGFGEHTDPQIISILRSNDTSGLQISLKNDNWISVPPDPSSFFIIVGDSLQVMTNGRFQSVRHRVLANSLKPRLSMIYFCGPPLREKIAPLQSITKGEESLYKEFTWFDYKNSAYHSKLADNRLGLFKRIAAS